MWAYIHFVSGVSKREREGEKRRWGESFSQYTHTDIKKDGKSKYLLFVSSEDDQWDLWDFFPCHSYTCHDDTKKNRTRLVNTNFCKQWFGWNTETSNG